MAKTVVCKAQELHSGKMRSVKVENNKILVANVNGEYYAMRAACNHMGGPLDEGELNGDEVTCPWHGSKWDVKTGKLVWFTMPLKDEPTYKVLVEGGIIFVET